MTSKDGEKVRGFLAFRRKKDSPKKIDQQSPHSFSSKTQGKRLDSKPRNAVISKSGVAGKANNNMRRVTKVGPQEVHWYPFYVAVFHDPPEDYYADSSKEELWWSREFLEQRLFESLAGQMMDEEDREHKHRLLQMGQDVVPTRRRSHDSVVVDITGDLSSAHEEDNVRATTAPESASLPVVIGQVAPLEEGQASSSNVRRADTDADHNNDVEQGEGANAEQIQGSGEGADSPKQKRSDDQINTQHTNERIQQNDEISEHERSILEQTQAYVRQYHELVEKGENVSGMMTPQEVITAAQKILQSSQSTQDDQRVPQLQSGEGNMVENEQKILAHTRAYVEQYNELARIGMNLQGMVTPEAAILAAQALLGGRKAVALDQKQQISRPDENSPKATGDMHHFGGPAVNQSRSPINLQTSRMPPSRHILPGPPVTQFSSNFYPRSVHSHSGTERPRQQDTVNRMPGSYGGPIHGVDALNLNQVPFPSHALNVPNTFGSSDPRRHVRGIDPLDKRFWRISKTGLPSSLKRDRGSQIPYNVRWPKEYITLVGEPIYVIFDPREMWWTGPELHYIDMENQRELETRQSAFVFDQECEVVFDRVIDECQVFQDRRKNPLRDLSALWNPKNLRKFITPNLIQGLVNGHRGLELDGLEGRREKTEEQYRIVFDYIACNFYAADNRVKKNRQEMGLSDAASDATLCDRVFAYIMGLADEMIVFGFDS